MAFEFADAQNTQYTLNTITDTQISNLNFMKWHQREIVLEPRPRGFHLITREVVSQLPEIKDISIGIAHLFIMHTSAALTMNENASSDVRRDMENYFNKFVPENEPYYEHTMEGSDDMPAHIKASVLGASLQLPVSNGGLYLGTWQGIYLCEHRNRGGARRIVATVYGT